MTRRPPVEVVILRNGQHGPLHLAIPVGGDCWVAACRLRDRRRTFSGPAVRTWGAGDPNPWLEVRTCPECAELGERADTTTELAILAGWVRPPSWGRAPTGRAVSRLRQ